MRLVLAACNSCTCPFCTGPVALESIFRQQNTPLSPPLMKSLTRLNGNSVVVIPSSNSTRRMSHNDHSLSPQSQSQPQATLESKLGWFQALSNILLLEITKQSIHVSSSLLEVRVTTLAVASLDQVVKLHQLVDPTDIRVFLLFGLGRFLVLR